MERASDANVLVLLFIDPLMPRRRPEAGFLGRMAAALWVAITLVYGAPSSVSAQSSILRPHVR